MNLKAAQKNLGDLVRRIAETGERLVLRTNGEAAAAIISLNDLALLEELEDQLDVKEAERRLADPSEKPIPWEQAKKEMGLK
ncbi:MAG: type II toxin-antitoxin system Phd/YefM family antitoxin [Acidobacteriota bacterium]